MKKIKLLMLIVLLCITSACDLKNGNMNVVSNNDSLVFENSNTAINSNEILPIYNIKNEKIGEISHFGFIEQINGSIIYSKISTTSNNLTNMEYFRYVINTKQNIKLGTVEGWSQQSLETVYINQHLFLFVIIGNVNSKENRILKLIDIDLNENSLSVVLSEKGGWPYNTMTAVEDKLLIAKVIENGSCIDEYDTISKQIRTLKKFHFNNETTVGETVRQISSSNDSISLMVLVKEKPDSVKLRIDTYSYDMKFLKSYDVSSISDDTNELKQGISNFEFLNGYLYYENFSITRIFGKVVENKIEITLPTNAEFAMAKETENNYDNKLFYQSYSRENNDLYFFDSQNGKVKTAKFCAKDSRYYIINMSRDINDNLLVTMYYRDPITGETLPPILYYINIAELNFQ